jgi:hypothetical protein
MKPTPVPCRIVPRCLALLVAASAACASGARGHDPEAGFTALFNGRDLTGWIYGTAGGKENRSGQGYRVEGGVIYCTPQDGGNLFTEKEYDNFIFRFEFRLTPNANNGIGIRAPLEGDAAYAGMEIQVLDDSGSDYRQLQPWQYHGSIYNVVAARRGSQRPVGEWNEEEIVANGTRVRVTVNGQVIVDADLSEVRDPATLAKHPGLARKSGHIGFLGHGARVEFRNLRIKPL